jgi:hypothetical protein
VRAVGLESTARQRLSDLQPDLSGMLVLPGRTAVEHLVIEPLVTFRYKTKISVAQFVKTGGCFPDVQPDMLYQFFLVEQF